MLKYYDNSWEFYPSFLVLLLFIVTLFSIVISSIVHYYAKRRIHEKQQTEMEQALLEARAEVQEETFRMISQELHDNLGQVLTLAKLQLNTLNWDKTELAKKKVSESVELIGQTIQSMRDLTRTMHTESIKQLGLVAVLELEMQRIGKLGIMVTAFGMQGEPETIDERIGLVIFRIVQEALHNVMRHSKATKVEMNIEFDPGRIKLTISDNGIGFRIIENMEGHGLRNMNDRARIINAQLTMEPGKTSGTSVTLNVKI